MAASSQALPAGITAKSRQLTAGSMATFAMFLPDV
jgi:hypothetical protein